MVLQYLGMAASVGGSLLQRREQKKAQRKAREERERLQRMGEQRQQEVESDFESLIETRRLQAAAENPALQAARRTMVRQKQHAAQIRMRARQGGLTPEQLEAYTLGGEFEEYIGEKTARLAEISAGTEAIERLTQAKAQAGSDIFKSTQAATAPLLGEEARLRAAAAQSGMGAALGALGAGLSLASQYGGGGGEQEQKLKTGQAHVGGDVAPPTGLGFGLDAVDPSAGYSASLASLTHSENTGIAASLDAIMRRKSRVYGGGR